MENLSVWAKYQAEVAVHLIRWNAEFTKKVGAALSATLAQWKQHGGAEPDDITAALLLRQQNPVALADLASRFGISEKQVWALLMDKADQASTSLERLSDARDQIHQLTAQEEWAAQQRLHANFNYGSGERQRQAARARKPRIKVGEGGEWLSAPEIIEKLAKAPQYADMSAKELWPLFVGMLDEHYLNPTEDDSQPGKIRCTYHPGGKQKNISFGHFANMVADHRKKKSD